MKGHHEEHPKAADGTTYAIETPPAEGEKTFDRHTHDLVVHKNGHTTRYALDHEPELPEILRLCEQTK